MPRLTAIPPKTREPEAASTITSGKADLDAPAAAIGSTGFIEPFAYTENLAKPDQ